MKGQDADKQIYIEQREVYAYPENQDLCAPGVKYPEYPYSDISGKENTVCDVIINLPKLQTYRFAGITGAQKNFVVSY